MRAAARRGVSRRPGMRGGGGGGKAWTPASLTNLRAWLRSDQLTLSGSNVTAWPDKSPAGNNFPLLGVSPTQVAAYNGTPYPSVRGNGSTQALRNTAFNWGALVDQYTIAFIGTILSCPSDAITWHYNGGGAQIPYAYAVAASQAAPKMFGPGNVISSGIETGLQPQLLVCSWDGANQKIYDSTRLGDSDANANAGPASGASFTLFASSAGGLFCNADLVEVIVMRKAITAAELLALSKYARNRYNIASRVLFCGDSLTYGYGPPYIGGFRPEVLTACTAAGVNTQQVGSVNGPNGFHRGYAGETLANVLANFNDTLSTTLTTTGASRLADIFFGLWGTNDALVNTGSDVSATMLTNAGLIMDIVKTNLPLAQWLWGTLPVPPDPSFAGMAASLNGYNAGLPALCAAKGFTCVPLHNIGITYLAASVHWDVPGYTTAANAIAPYIIRSARA